MKSEDRAAIKVWNEHLRNLMRSLSVDHTESETDKMMRLRGLEADPEKWVEFYFPAYATHAPAPFHKKAFKRVLANTRHYEVRAWSRELAKTTRVMMEVLYLVLVKKRITNTLMISNSYDNAVRLLAGYKGSLEHNQRIINDYGTQVGTTWTAGEFVTRKGAAFRALGAGQSPRGTKNENWRVNCILIDDIDTDEECRNEMRIKAKFKWIEKALIPTLSMSGDYLIMVCGNIIAPVCTVKLLIEKSNYHEIINVRDKNGNSVWAKNSEADIDQFLNMLSYAAQQGEFFNNPITEGSVFTELLYKPARPLREYRYLICYTDPSFKESKKNDFKATVLCGRHKDEFHVLKAYVEQTTTARMIDWHYDIMDYVNGVVPVYYYMEANLLQDTILAEFGKASIERNRSIPITGDMRKKPDKFTRIESLLEPLNRNGKLWLNEREKAMPGMRTLEEQFLSLEPGSTAHDDAPDAVEGALFLINQKDRQLTPDSLKVLKPKKSKKRY